MNKTTITISIIILLALCLYIQYLHSSLREEQGENERLSSALLALQKKEELEKQAPEALQDYAKICEDRILEKDVFIEILLQEIEGSNDGKKQETEPNSKEKTLLDLYNSPLKF